MGKNRHREIELLGGRVSTHDDARRIVEEAFETYRERAILPPLLRSLMERTTQGDEAEGTDTAVASSEPTVSEEGHGPPLSQEPDSRTAPAQKPDSRTAPADTRDREARDSIGGESSDAKVSGSGEDGRHPGHR